MVNPPMVVGWQQVHEIRMLYPPATHGRLVVTLLDPEYRNIAKITLSTYGTFSVRGEEICERMNTQLAVFRRTRT